MPLAAGSNPDPIKEARNLYYQGIYGDKAAVAKADELFAKLHSDKPDDVLVTVYYGSLRLLEAQHTWALWKKNSLSKEGVQLMDGAVAAAPANLEVRFVRGATERELPSFFGRKKQAQEDLRSVANSPELGTLESRLAAAAFYYCGLDDLDGGNSVTGKEALRKAVQIAPDSHAGGLAAEKLKALP